MFTFLRAQAKGCDDRSQGEHGSFTVMKAEAATTVPVYKFVSGDLCIVTGKTCTQFACDGKLLLSFTK